MRDEQFVLLVVSVSHRHVAAIVPAAIAACDPFASLTPRVVAAARGCRRLDPDFHHGLLGLGELSGTFGGDGDDPWPVNLGGGCIGWHLIAAGDDVEVDAGGAVEPLPPFGEPGALGAWSVQCMAGTVPVGIEARFANDIPNQVVALRLACATPTIELVDEVPEVVLGPASPSPWSASRSTNTRFASMCPPGAVAIGFASLVEDSAIHRLATACAVPTLVLGPP